MTSNDFKKVQRIVLPGEKLATIEEFIAGSGSVIIGDLIVSTVLGEVAPDMSNRIMNVKPPRQHGGPPSTNDYIIGIVQSAQPSIAQVKIVGLNEYLDEREFSGMLSMRDDRRRRTTSPIKAGDVIRAKVSSTKNAIYHLTLEGSNCGVLYTVCSQCGAEVFALNHERVKCKNCGFIDERIVADDFLKISRGHASS